MAAGWFTARRRTATSVAGERPRRRLAGIEKPRPLARPGLIGRSSVIRTRDPLLPKQVRYQAALYSVKGPRLVGNRPARRARLDAALYSRLVRAVQAPRTAIFIRLRTTVKRCRNPAQLGRRQVVRHRFLVPTFPGSNPGAPASLRLLRKLRLGKLAQDSHGEASGGCPVEALAEADCEATR